ERSTVVCNNFFESAPPAQDLFKDEVADSFAGFPLEHAELWPSDERAAGLNNHLVTGCQRHEERIKICLPEERRGQGDSRWNKELARVTGLTLV
ncbi:hypothetical protein FIBSPDRAFT_707976, partial [Athelia psychrophila]